MKQQAKKIKQFLAITLIATSLSIQADDDGQLFDRWYSSSKSGVSAVQFQQYNDVCGQCHFPYQPGLLPAISWEKVMMNTDVHFGQPLTMTAVEKRTVTRYLLDNSAGHVNDEISNRILQSLKYNPVPIRITKTPYWKSRHNNIKDNMINQKPFQCDQCHQDAQKGQYNTFRDQQSTYSQ